MDVHKPKPVGSWREFLAEMGVIVVGILIALSLEQVVENFREHREQQEARDAVHDELASDLANVMRRKSTQACIDHRLGEIASLIDALGRGETVQAATWIGRPVIWSANSSRWAAATQGGRTSLFSNQEQAGYGVVYDVLRSITGFEEQEQLTWARLRALQGQTKLPPAAVNEYRIALKEAMYGNWRINFDLLRLSEGAAAIKLKPTPGGPPGAQFKLAPACVPIDTPVEKAEAMIGSPYGNP